MQRQSILTPAARFALKSASRAVLAAAVFLAPAVQAAPGDLDTSFNGNGIVTDPFGSGFSEAFGVTVQTDGKIVVVGSHNNELALARYNDDGSPDDTFNPSFPGGTNSTPIGSGASVARAATIGDGGTILVAGESSTSAYKNFTVARYTSDGLLDTGFNSGSSTDAAGTHVTSIGTGDSVANAIALQADGSIVAGGYATNNGIQQFALARYTSGGDLDTSFNPHGDNGAAPGTVMTVVDSAISAVQALAVQPDGRIVAAGSSTGSTPFKVVLVRYDPNGTPDTHFGPNGDGRVATAMGTGDSLAYGMTLDADGKIIVAGQASQGGSKGFALARYNTDGTLDTDFNGSGTVITPITGLTDARAEAVAMEPDGKIVAAGFGVNASNRTVVAVARYTANGTLDTTFGSGGIQTTAMGAGDARAHAIALQTDGKIIVAGKAVSSTSSAPYVMGTARYLAADTPWDLTPDAFHFDNVRRAVVPNTVQTSKMITVSGLGQGIQVPVTVSDGEYAKNGASAYTVNMGWAKEGDQFNVRHTSIAGEINTTLTIGGMVSANNSKIVLGKTTADAFSSLSVSILGGGSGALAGLSLAILALAWGVSRRRSGP